VDSELRVLVYPHAGDIGGSQLNAVELAAAVRDRGHDVAVICEDGPLVQRVHESNLPHIELPTGRRRPAPSTARKLRELVRARQLSIVHGYEWPPGLEAAAAVLGTPAAAVCTVMSMAVAPFLPPSMPLVVGTRALQERTARGRSGSVYLIEPPVDVDLNAPGHPVDEFRARYGLLDEAGAPHMVTLAIVGRLATELKLEGLLTAIDVVGELAAEHPLRLVIVGDGEARSIVEERAAKANARAGRRAVILTGQLFDPRPAYAAADILLGMGGSALRALAFQRPLVVQGERGFWRLLTPESCELFLRQGWYGAGDGTGGHERLSGILLDLMRDPGRRAQLGAFGRDLAVSRFSLQAAAVAQEQIYRDALAQRAGTATAAVEGARSAAGVLAHKLRRRYRRLRGGVAAEDFNTVTLAQEALQKTP
jgi:glycosyltransferase involved in cell wall biosynthesis